MYEPSSSTEELEIRRRLESLGDALEEEVARHERTGIGGVAEPPELGSQSRTAARVLQVAAVMAIAATLVAVVALVTRGRQGGSTLSAGTTAGTHTAAEPTSTSPMAATLSPQAVLSKVLPLAEAKYGISFPDDAIARALQERDDNRAAFVQTMPAQPGVSVVAKSAEDETLRMLSVGGTTKDGDGVALTVVTYPRGGAYAFAATLLYPGAHPVEATGDASGCTMWRRDNTYPGGRSLRTVAASCPTATLGVVTKSTVRDHGTAVTPSEARSLLLTAIR